MHLANISSIHKNKRHKRVYKEQGAPISESPTENCSDIINRRPSIASKVYLVKGNYNQGPQDIAVTYKTTIALLL